MSEKPKSLQELIAANALIDAFMGSSTHTPRQQHPEAKVEAILASIESCDDIESLAAGVQFDVQFMSADIDTNTTNGVGVGAGVGVTTPVQFETLAARLSRIKSLLYNERTAETSFAQSFFHQASQFKTVASALLHAILLTEERTRIFPILLSNLNNIPFEARKDVASIFNYLLVCGCVYNVGTGGGVVNEVQMEGSSEATTASYTKTMLGFVEYVYEHYEQIMRPIVNGHHVTNAHGTTNLNNKKEVEDATNDAQNASLRTQARTLPLQVNSVDVALHCGSMYRSTLRHPKLFAQLISKPYSELFIYPFLDSFGPHSNFEVSSDGLETLRLIMHPSSGGIAVPSLSITSPSTMVTSPSELENTMEGLVASYLDTEFEDIFMKRFNQNLLNSDNANYITRRVSLQILSAVLLTRTNYKVMMKYISNRSNLKTIMMLLRDSSAHITLEAFNVFKIFVANPTKPDEIIRILADNKVKLVKYLTGLHQEKEANDEQFRDEKALVIATLQQLD
eukprot:825710_1